MSASEEGWPVHTVQCIQRLANCHQTRSGSQSSSELPEMQMRISYLRSDRGDLLVICIIDL